MVTIVTLLVVGVTTVYGKPSPQMASIEGHAALNGCNVGVMKNKTVSEGNPVSLTCPLTLGSTCMVSTIKWYKSHTLDGPRKQVQSAYNQFPLKFFIQGAYEEDDGFYWCVTTNFHAGNGNLVETSAYVKILGKAGAAPKLVFTTEPIVVTQAPILANEALPLATAPPAWPTWPIQSYNQRPIEPPNHRPIEPPNQRPIQSYNQRPIQSNNQRPIQSYNQRPIQPYNQRPIQPYNQRPIQSTNQRPIQPYNQSPSQSYNQRPIQPSNQRPNTEERQESIEAILGSHLGAINHQLSELNNAIRDFGRRITALEIKTKDL